VFGETFDELDFTEAILSHQRRVANQEIPRALVISENAASGPNKPEQNCRAFSC
jgi:hypothetical protein